MNNQYTSDSCQKRIEEMMQSSNSIQPGWRWRSGLLVGMPLLANAQTPSATNSVAATSSSVAAKFADPSLSVTSMPSAMGSMVQAMFGLLVVLAVMFALLWVMRRYKWARASVAGLQVIQGISLGQKERAVIVRVQGRQLLLGVAPGQVTLLTELEATVDASLDAPSMPSGNEGDATSFKAVLKRSLGIAAQPSSKPNHDPGATP